MNWLKFLLDITLSLDRAGYFRISDDRDDIRSIPLSFGIQVRDNKRIIFFIFNEMIQDRFWIVETNN